MKVSDMRQKSVEELNKDLEVLHKQQGHRPHQDHSDREAR